MCGHNPTPGQKGTPPGRDLGAYAPPVIRGKFKKNLKEQPKIRETLTKSVKTPYSTCQVGFMRIHFSLFKEMQPIFCGAIKRTPISHTWSNA